VTGIRIKPELCLVCKGYRNLCGLPRCPILERRLALSRVGRYINGHVDGSSPPSVVVGEVGYPVVKVMFNKLAVLEEAVPIIVDREIGVVELPPLKELFSSWSL